LLTSVDTRRHRRYWSVIRNYYMTNLYLMCMCIKQAVNKILFVVFFLSFSHLQESHQHYKAKIIGKRQSNTCQGRRKP